MRTARMPRHSLTAYQHFFFRNRNRSPFLSPFLSISSTFNQDETKTNHPVEKYYLDSDCNNFDCHIFTLNLNYEYLFFVWLVRSFADCSVWCSVVACLCFAATATGFIEPKNGQAPTAAAAEYQVYVRCTWMILPFLRRRFYVVASYLLVSF